MTNRSRRARQQAGRIRASAAFDPLDRADSHARSKPFTFQYSRSRAVAQCIGMLAVLRNDTDIGLLEELACMFPGLTLQDYLGGLFVHRAQSGVPGYVLRHVSSRMQ